MINRDVFLLFLLIFTVLTGCSSTHVQDSLSGMSTTSEVAEKNASMVSADDQPLEKLTWIPVDKTDVDDLQQPLSAKLALISLSEQKLDSTTISSSIIADSHDRYQSLIERTSAEFGLDADLLHAMVYAESRYQPKAVSPKGAIGLLQVMPATGKRFGINDLHDPQSNLRAGASYIKWLMKYFDNDLTLVLAAYNAGENAVQRYGRQIPPYPETQRYVKKVLAYYQQQSHVIPSAVNDGILPEVEEDNKIKGTKATSTELAAKLLGLLFSTPSDSTSLYPREQEENSISDAL